MNRRGAQISRAIERIYWARTSRRQSLTSGQDAVLIVQLALVSVFVVCRYSLPELTGQLSIRHVLLNLLELSNNDQIKVPHCKTDVNRSFNSPRCICTITGTDHSVISACHVNIVQFCSVSRQQCTSTVSCILNSAMYHVNIVRYLCITIIKIIYILCKCRIMRSNVVKQTSTSREYFLESKV